MNTSQWIALTAVTSLLSAYSGFKLAYYLPKENSIPESLTKHATTPHSSTSLIKIKTSDSQPSHEARKKVLSHYHQPYSVSSDKRAGNKTEASEHYDAESLTKKLKRQQDDINRFRHFLSNAKENALPLVNNRYELERFDPEWAKHKEEQLLTLFEHDGYLSQFAPTALSCKSKNCRIVLAVEQQKQGQALYKHFREIATKGNKLNQSQTISFFGSEGTGEVYFFVSENSGKDLLSLTELDSAL